MEFLVDASIKKICTCLFLIFCAVSVFNAQSSSVCQTQDCSIEVLTIKLPEPIKVEAAQFPNASRLSAFKEAYFKLKTIESDYPQDLEWQKKFIEGLTSGENCIQHYYLKGRLVYEYDQHPDFKDFIDQQESNSTAFQLNGFGAMKHSLSLYRRMQQECPRQISKAESDGKISLEDMSTVYRRLAEILGYFDVLGQFDDITEGKKKPGKTAQQLKTILADLTMAPIWQGDLDLLSDNQQKAMNKVNEIVAAQQPLQSAIDVLDKEQLACLNDLGLIKKKHRGMEAKAKKKGGKWLKVVKDLVVLALGLEEKFNKIKGVFNFVKEEFGFFKGKAKKIKDALAQRGLDLRGLKGKVTGLIKDKGNLNRRLDNPLEDIAELENLVDAFGQKYKDLSNAMASEVDKKKDWSDQIQELTNMKSSLSEKVADLQLKLGTLCGEKDDLAVETTKADEEMDQSEVAEPAAMPEPTPEPAVAEALVERQQEALELEEKILKEEFGTAIKLNPVPAKEWKEGFEVDRDYWNAMFHPDDELVEGMKGRYFEVRLKNAQKQVKLLFDIGKYTMEKRTFRRNYGATIGAFVAEALNRLERSDAKQVKVFIQGSADIVGHKTYKGQMDPNYTYKEVDVLPMLPSDEERFSGNPVSRQIPQEQFGNEHLPNLRARFLKSMLSVYSKKLDPVLLDGIVQEYEAEEERNAIIYLYFPEKILSKY